MQDTINGQADLSIDTVNKAEMSVIYRPVNVFRTTWAVLLMQPQIINAIVWHFTSIETGFPFVRQQSKYPSMRYMLVLV